MGDLKRYEQAFQNLPEAVDAAELYEGRNKSFGVDVRDGAIDSYDVSDIAGRSVRVDCGQIGYAYSEAPDESPEHLIAKAKENASYVETEDAKYMRFFEGSKTYPTLPLVDKRLEAATAKQKIELAFALEAKIKGMDKRIEKLESCSISTAMGETRIMNSLGLNVSSKNGYAVAYASPVALEVGEYKNGSAFEIAPCLEELNLDRLAQEAVEDLFSQFGAKSVPSGSYDILVKNRAMNSLIAAFAGMFNAEAAQKGLSLLAGKENEMIASPLISIVDDPMHAQSIFKQAFDDEGVAAQYTVVLEKGMLKTLLHNRKTAMKAGCETTGNAQKSGIAGPIGVSPSNFILQEGEQTFEQLCASLGKGLCITEFSGLHSGANAISGDFSLLCKGFLVEGGKIGQAVEQITVAGNFLDMMKKARAVGKDLRYGLSSIVCPSILFEGMQVAGE